MHVPVEPRHPLRTQQLSHAKSLLKMDLNHIANFHSSINGQKSLLQCAFGFPPVHRHGGAVYPWRYKQSKGALALRFAGQDLEADPVLMGISGRLLYCELSI